MFLYNSRHLLSRFYCAVILIGSSVTGLISSATAADIETLLMPGELVSSHAKYETECSRCHVRFSKDVQSELCLGCHEAVDQDIWQGQGYHGLDEAVSNKACKDCHTDHEGREADILQLNTATFDHAKTDFPITGRHTDVACKACHAEGKKYSAAPSECISCHEKQDPHAGKLGKKCASCHTEKDWQEYQFEHDKTEYPLQGAHAEVACNSCHINQQYKETAKQCASCHYLDDVHSGNNGRECQDCHSEKKWTETDFDHNSSTDFKLRGAHSKVKCASCHIAGKEDKAAGKTCIACHAADDRHNKRYGEKCADCHNEKSWSKTDFDHASSGNLRLEGKHAELVCNACHRGVLAEEKLSTSCVSCHKPDDVHNGQQGKQCEQCHQQNSWLDKIVFDHDLSHFPLLGLHATAPCESCHLSNVFQDAKTGCNSCHAAEDKHEGALGEQCNQCHNPNGWKLWLFDHDQQTEFKLNGAHTDLQCGLCHTTPLKEQQSIPSNCASCHAQDDVHQRRFGPNCARCHSEQSFKGVINR